MVKLERNRKMKTDIFIQAIRNRNNLQFLYNLQEVNIEPYYISKILLARKLFMAELGTLTRLGNLSTTRLPISG
jgi:hypothetical protein